MTPLGNGRHPDNSVSTVKILVVTIKDLWHNTNNPLD